MALSLRVCVLLCLFFVSAAVTPAQAIGVDPQTIPDLPTPDFMPQKEFEDKTQLIQETPFNDPYLAYEVRLPKEWGETADPPKTTPDHKGVSDRVIGIIAAYSSPWRYQLRSFFTIEALELDYEINARNWFINYTFNNGYTLSALKEISENEIEAAYVELRDDITYAVRVRAIINGPRVLVMRYYVPQEDFADERIMQAQALNSFKLLHFEDRFIETHKTYGFVDQSYFNYPASWTIDAPLIKSIDRMKVILFSGDDVRKPEGQINVYVISKLLGTSLAQEVRDFRDSINIPGYRLGKIRERLDMPYDKSLWFGMTESYRLEPQGNTMIDYEYVVSVMEGADYYYIVSLITPSREEEFYNWAKNLRAFRIVAETMRRNDK